MIDISGYSKITSQLVLLGKVASELITGAVNEYFCKVISTVYTYGGDVVKFLGDAVLVSFSSKTSDESLQDMIQRAFMCCMDIMSSNSTITINLDSKGALGDYETIKLHRKITEYIKAATSDKTESLNPNIITLGAHAALTCGSEITHVIMGLSETRMDYSLQGPDILTLGALLDNSSVGDLAVDVRTMSYLSPRLIESLQPFTKKHQTMIIINPAAATAGLGNTITDLYRQRDSDFAQSEIPGYIPADLDMSGERLALCEEDQVDILSKFCNKSLLRQLVQSADQTSPSQSQIKFRGEFRKVSVVFAKLPASTSPETANKIFVEFVKSLEKWQGVLQQYAMDDKGQTLLGCFGLPPWTFEKDALHAWKAVTEFSINLEKMGMKETRIAIASGELLFTELGSSLRGDASLLGDVVNLAARLLSISETSGTSVCDKATYEKIMQDVQLSHLGDFMVKGKTEAIPVYGIKRQTGVNPEAPTFVSVGYGPERALLMEKYRDWRQDRSGFVAVIEGKSGSGKSTLLQSLVNTFTSDCMSHWIRDGQESSTPKQDSLTRKNAVKRLLVKLFKLMTNEHKIIFTFDDCQWMDIMSLEILQNIVAECPKICILFFTRPIESEHEALQHIVSSPGTLHMKLRGLLLNETEQLIGQKLKRLKTVKVEPRLLKAMHEHCEGQPLYVDMLLGALQVESEESAVEITESGILQAKRWDLFEETVKNIQTAGPVIVQFDRLDNVFKDILRKASIFGKQYFNLSDVANALELGSVDLKELIEIIARMDKYSFLAHHNGTESNDAEMYFRHSSVMTAVYESLPYEQRIEYHLKVAQYYERQMIDNIDESLMTAVSHHYSRTSDLAKHVQYLENLAYGNLLKCYYNEASNSLEKLIAIQQNDPIRQADWISHNAYALVIMKKSLDKIVELCDNALALVGLSFPKNLKDVKKALLKSAFRLLILWQKTKGGQRVYKHQGVKCQYFPAGVTGHYFGEECKGIHSCIECPKVRRVSALCFKSILIRAISMPDIPETSALALIELCNVSIRTGEIDAGEWLECCHRGLSLYGKAPWLCRKFRRKAEVIAKERKLHSMDATMYLIAFINFNIGSPESANCYVDKATSYHQQRGDTASVMMTHGVKCQFGFWLGNFHEVDKVTAPYTTWEASDINPLWGNSIVFFASSFFTWILIGHSEFAPTYASMTPKVSAHEIKAACETLLKRAKIFVKSAYLTLPCWSIAFYQAGLYMMSGKQSKAMGLLTSRIKSTSRQDERDLRSYPMLKAMLFAVVGKFHQDGETRARYGGEARQLLEGMGAVTLARWLRDGKWKWLKAPSVWMMLIPMAMHMMAWSLLTIPLQGFFLERACRELGVPTTTGPATTFIYGVVLPTPPSSYASLPMESYINNTVVSSEPGTDPCRSSSESNSLAAYWNTIYRLTNSLPSIPIIPFIGILLDSYGHKTIATLSILSHLLIVSSLLLVSAFEWPMWVLFMSSFIDGCLGGYQTMTMVSYTYLSHTTTTVTRTANFARLEAMVTGIHLAVPYVGGLLTGLGDVKLSFGFAWGLEALVLLWLYAVFMEAIPSRRGSDSDGIGVGGSSLADANESSQTQSRSLNNHETAPLLPSTSKTTQPTPPTPSSSAFQQTLTSLHETLHLFLQTPPIRLLSLSLFFIVFSAAGVQGYILLYTVFKFHWGALEQGQFLLSISVIKMFYMLVVLPVVLKLGGRGLDALRRFAFELGVMRVALGLFVVGYPLYGLVTEGWMMPLVVVFDGFGATAAPLARGILSRSVKPDFQGRLFGGLNVLDATAYSVSGIFFGIIYTQTVQFQANLFLFVVSAILGLALVITFFVNPADLARLGADIIHEAEEVVLSRDEERGSSSEGSGYGATREADRGVVEVEG
ncbi:hypothetical protein HDV05_002488 [Chytridiales sp. JEL 0842]|nr:hypothetical protein HDV05_002488 [Chytridiales sp. JEL 0842]